MRRSRFLPTVFAVACLAAVVPTDDTRGADAEGDAKPDAKRPNVLLILVDDLKPALGCYGDETAKTPHIDALAARGMRFDLAYCNQAVCAPSRFTLMLGSHSTSTGLYGLGSPLREILPDAVTLPQHFAKHGDYHTESLGKIFHIGHGNHGDPASFSIPHFKEKVIEYADPASKPGGKLTREEAMFQNVPAPAGGMNSLPRGAAFESPDVDDDAYADGRVAAETAKRLQAAKVRREKDGTPFFIAAGFARPHLPFSAPKKYWDLYDPADLPMPEFEDLPKDSPAVAGKRGGEIRNYFPVPDKNDPAAISDEVKRELIHGYYASTSYVDAQIGTVIDELDRLGLAENTIVVLWGDHGFHLGDLGIWTKHTNYEQANRIPILIAAPGVTEPGSSTRHLAESVDIFPTLAELADLPEPEGPQPIDGISLVPVLEDPKVRLRDHAFHAYPKGRMGRAIRTQRHRLVEWKQPGADAETAEIELYDYQLDPNETRNLAADKPKVVERLRAILGDYPEAVSRQRKKNNAAAASAPAKAAAPPAGVSPKIAGQTLRIITETKADEPRGVVLAQGGREHGYAVHFIDGRPAFDVRIDGRVTRVMVDFPVEKNVRLEATLDREWMMLSVDGGGVTRSESPGLIRVQPKDALSIGQDLLSAAGNYEAPNPFNGTVLNTRVEAGGKPPEIAPVMSRAEIEAGWPHWRGPQHDGIAAETLPADLPDELPVAWRAEVGIGFSSVAIAGDRALTMGNHDNVDTVWCFDAASGKRLWKHAYPCELDPLYYEGGPGATPTIHDGSVYTLSKKGHAFRLDLQTGEVIWKRDLVADHDLELPEWSFAGSAFVDRGGDRVILNVGRGGMALDLETGKTLWLPDTDTAGYSTAVPFRRDDSRSTHLLFSAKSLIAIDATDGHLAWEFPWKCSRDVNAADPIVTPDGRIVLSNSTGTVLLAPQGDGTTPKVIWEQRDLKWYFNPGVLVGDHIYSLHGTTHRPTELTCTDAQTGKAVWAEEGFGSGGVIAAGNTIIVFDQGTLTLFEASPEGYQPMHRQQVLGGKCWTAPALADGRIFVRNAEGDLACLRLRP